MTDLELSEAIRALRSELASAMQAASGEQILFRVGPVDLELEVSLSVSAGGKAGVKFYVVTVEGNAGTVSGSTHKIKVHLDPITATGQEIYTGQSISELPE